MNNNTSMKSFIKNEIEKVKQTYITAPERIISDYNNEREKIKEYNGRQLLEMLQNADDEANNTKNKTGDTLNTPQPPRI